MKILDFSCKVDGCDRLAQYRDQAVCQKHYFRMMRYGTYDLVRKGKARKEEITPNGYKRIYKPDHALADKNGFVFQHRYVLFESIGFGNHECELCGKEWNWRGKYDHVDHIDKNKLNNSIDNLRPLCNPCNSRRE